MATLTRDTKANVLKADVNQEAKSKTYTFSTKNKFSDSDIKLKVTIPDAKFTTSGNKVYCSTAGFTAVGSETKTIAKIGTDKAAATYTPGTTDQQIAAGNYLSGIQTIKGDSNLISDNIKKDTKIFNVTGTLDYVKTVTSVPSTKDTSIVYNSTDGKYYLWK